VRVLRVVTSGHQLGQASRVGEIVEQVASSPVDDDDAAVAVRSEQGVVIVVERDVKDIARSYERARRYDGVQPIGFDMADGAGAVFAGMHEETMTAGHVGT
jgi:hypothetical protein